MKSPPRHVIYPDDDKANWEEQQEDNVPDDYAITVGDLCFVALGQIVNRRFNAERPFPSSGTLIVVRLPTRPPLRPTIVSEWGGLVTLERRQGIAHCRSAEAGLRRPRLSRAAATRRITTRTVSTILQSNA